MSKKKILYDGKAKTIFEGPTSDTVIQYFKDDATANNAEKHSIINGKGVLNNSISDSVSYTHLTLPTTPYV